MCLEKLGVNFLQYSPNIDEQSLPNETPAQLVQRLSHQKAQAGQQYIRNQSEQIPSLVIGSDQVLVVEDQIFGKPKTHANAVAQLSALSGQTCEFLTGLCLLADANHSFFKHRIQIGLERTAVTFRTLSLEQIEAYLALEQPFDCAGSFKSEAGGVMLCQSISGRDPNSLVGLPLMLLLDMLTKLGYVLPLTHSSQS